MNIFTDLHPPMVAGQFYPSAPSELAATLERALSLAPADAGGRVRALLVPHAGYFFSGDTAGCAYGLLTRISARYERVVVLAPAHSVPFRTIAIGSYRAYQTPLGEIPVDQDICRQLADASPLFSLRQDAHRREHALEVQLPFLQTALADTALVPLVCGQVESHRLQPAAQVLADHLWHPSNLWVISSDFTHYGSAFGYLPFAEDIPENLRQLDLGAVDMIKEKNPRGFIEYLDRTEATICGSVPISLLLFALKTVGADNIEPKLLDYTRSGDRTGDYHHCVSYVSMSFVEP